MPIDVVLFDYSGVMTEPFNVPSVGVPFDLDALFGEMVAAMSPEPEHLWHELERGAISLADFIDWIEQRVPGCGAAFAADSELNVMANLDLRPDRVELVRSVAASGRRVGLLTNNVAEWEPLWRAALPGDLFEVVLDSSALGCRKPDAEIYELALDRFDATPERTLFIDDWTWNVDGAVAAGLHGLHCGSDTDLDAALGAALSL